MTVNKQLSATVSFPRDICFTVSYYGIDLHKNRAIYSSPVRLQHRLRSESPSASPASSVGSSIRACEDSDCYLGYLGSYESDAVIPEADDDATYNTSVVCSGHDKDNEVADDILGDTAISDVDANQALTETIPYEANDSEKSLYVQKIDDVSDSEDEWVVLNNHLDLLPVSSVVKCAKPGLYDQRKSSPIDITGSRIRDSSADKCCATVEAPGCLSTCIQCQKSDVIDLSEWTILSMKITERPVNGCCTCTCQGDNHTMTTDTQSNRTTNTKDSVQTSSNSRNIVSAKPEQVSSAMTARLFQTCKNRQLGENYLMAVCFILPKQ